MYKPEQREQILLLQKDKSFHQKLIRLFALPEVCLSLVTKNFFKHSSFYDTNKANKGGREDKIKFIIQDVEGL